MGMGNFQSIKFGTVLLSMSVIFNEAQSAPAFQCQGRPIQKIDLSYQFGPTKDQSAYYEDWGACYSYAAVAAVEAAVFRQEGTKYNLSEEYAASVSAAIDAKIPHFFRSIAKYRSLEATLNSEDSGWEHYEKSYSYNYFNGGFPTEVASAVIRHGYLPRKSEFLPYFDKLNQILSGEAKSDIESGIPGVDTLIKTQWLQEANYKFLSHLHRTSKLSPAPFSLNQFNTHVIYHNISAGILPPFIKVPGKSQLKLKSQCFDPNLQQKVIDTVNEYLCRRIPVIVSTNASGLEVKLPFRDIWYALETPDMHSFHAMVIEGVEYHNSKPYFMVRNSYEEGTPQNPHASVARIAAEDLCKITELSVVTAPVDKI